MTTAQKARIIRRRIHAEAGFSDGGLGEDNCGNLSAAGEVSPSGGIGLLIGMRCAQREMQMFLLTRF